MKKASLKPNRCWLLVGWLLLTLTVQASITVEMQLNNRGYGSLDHFLAKLCITNQGDPIRLAEIYGVLEVFDEYYFWPDFGREINYRVLDLWFGDTTVTLLDFELPLIDEFIPLGPLYLWGGWYGDLETYGYDVAEFWLDPARRWTPTATAPPTVTETATLQPTPTATTTPRLTPTAAASFTITAAPTLPEPSATAAPSITASPTVSPSPTPLLSPTASPRPTDTPALFVMLLGGDFVMGSPPTELCRTGLETQHSVTLTRGLAMQTTEVTQQQWVRFFGSNPSFFVDPSRPVELVTWFDAVIYCNRLSSYEGWRPCYYWDQGFSEVFDGTPPVTNGTVYWDQTADGYRLPTEAEWEYGCRAGTTTAYNSGQNNSSCEEDQELDPLGWYYYNSDTGFYQMTQSVGGKAPNLWGLYDMHGNVWEWCWNWHESYPPEPVIDPVGPATGTQRDIRGGSYDCSARSCRSAVRFYAWPSYRNCVLGFRVARTVTTATKVSR